MAEPARIHGRATPHPALSRPCSCEPLASPTLSPPGRGSRAPCATGCCANQCRTAPHIRSPSPRPTQPRRHAAALSHNEPSAPNPSRLVSRRERHRVSMTRRRWLSRRVPASGVLLPLVTTTPHTVLEDDAPRRVPLVAVSTSADHPSRSACATGCCVNQCRTAPHIRSPSLRPAKPRPPLAPPASTRRNSVA